MSELYFFSDSAILFFTTSTRSLSAYDILQSFSSGERNLIHSCVGVDDHVQNRFLRHAGKS